MASETAVQSCNILWIGNIIIVLVSHYFSDTEAFVARFRFLYVMWWCDVMLLTLLAS